MNKNEARVASRKLNEEAFSLTPSAVITLFEIDMADVAFEAGLSNKLEFDAGAYTFRFHNNSKIGNTSIVWQGKEYTAAPIKAEGFEITSRGTQPTPRLAITVNEEGIRYLSLFKEKMQEIGDLVGARVTRIRTFAKYLDADNFISELPPANFDPNPNVEFPRDVYFVERKSVENKRHIEFELSSQLDLEGLKLPGRLVLNHRCLFSYRGEGCLYEYKERRVEAVHGKEGKSTLPQNAPAIATVNNELITDILGVDVVDKGEWSFGKVYAKGHSVYITKNGIKYYFVARQAAPTEAPPDPRYWLADVCAKDEAGCKIRYRTLNGGRLPYGGFPGVNKFA